MKIKVHHYLDGQSVVYPDDWLLREVVSRASYTRYKERVRARIAREVRISFNAYEGQYVYIISGLLTLSAPFQMSL